MLSQGQSIEIFKGVGDPTHRRPPRSAARSGSHAIGHTRMATESAVTIAGSHPFSTGEDTCLVHNGSLSNHNRLREQLARHGERFQTENDSEVAAAYLTWRTREGDTLRGAGAALNDLDGFYTFVVGTRDGFAVLRDPVACKPAVMAETDDWVAFGTEFRALRRCPASSARASGSRSPPPSMPGAGPPDGAQAARSPPSAAQLRARPRAHDGARGEPVAARRRRRRFPDQEPARRARHRRGLDGDFNVTIDGHVGYYCAGMNKHASSRSTATPAPASPRT